MPTNYTGISEPGGPRIHRVKKVESLATTYLADDDAVRRHSQSLVDEHLDRDRATTLGVWQPTFERDTVRQLTPQVQLGLVLDRDNPLVRTDESGKHTHERRLA